MKRIQIKELIKKINLFFLLILLFNFFRVDAQALKEEIPIEVRYQSLLIGIGNAKIYDSYLSPLVYKGINFGLAYESMKNTKWKQGHISVQHLFNLEIADTDNLTRTATDYWGGLDYNFGMHYKFSLHDRLLLFSGVQANGLAGCIYNTRNGNNPASAKAHVNLNLSGMVTYQFTIGGQPLFVRYQLSSPFLGAYFAPQFGQSYYEIGLGVDARLVHFSSFHNYRAIRNIFSLDIPLNRCTIRLSYSNWIYETNINDLDTRIVTNSFYFGFSRNIFSISGKKSKNKYIKTVFDIE